MAKRKTPPKKPSPLKRPEPNRVDMPIDHLILSRDLQPRARLNPETVAEYAEIYRIGGLNAMEPIRAFTDKNGDAILTRGFTRVAAAREAKLTHLPCDLYPEPEEEIDILLDSLSGNKHGQKLTNADKQRALELYHSKVEVKLWGTTREVSMLLGCSHDLVAEYRKKLSAPAREETPEPKQGKIETAPYQKANVHNASPILDMEGIEQLATDLCKNIKSLTMEEAMVLSILWDLQAFAGSSALCAIVRNTMPTQPDEEDFIELIEDFRQSCYIESEGDEFLWLTEEGQKEILSTLNKRPPSQSPKEPQTQVTTRHETPEQPKEPKRNPTATIDKAREILADRIVEEPMRAFRIPGRQREIYLLACIVGIDSNGMLQWGDSDLDAAELAFAQGLAKRTAEELKRGNERIGTIGSIALLWDLDPNAIMILAERATK
jgi:hypothetical protein